MKSVIRIGSITVSLALVACCGTLVAKTPKTHTSSTLEAVDAIVQHGIDSKSYPGAVLIIGRPGKTIVSKAYGHMTYDADAKPMTMDTIFDLASVTKVVGSATTAMKLIEEKRLSLDDRVCSHIQEFGCNGKDVITVRDLMTHVSGLKSYESAAIAEKERKPGESTADALIQKIARLPLAHEPRTTVTYSCLNMLTEARINENILKGRQDEFLRKNIYGPLGMKDTVYRLSDEQKARTAPTSRGKDGESNAGKIHDPIANYHSPEEHCPGNAGLFSTAPDLAKYCEMILSEGKGKKARVFKPETIRLMTSLQTPPGITNLRALGWDIYPSAPFSTPLNQTDETRVIAHTGFTGTFIWLDKFSKTYFVFLTNRVWPDEPKAGADGVAKARKGIADIVLRSQPQYKKVFASKQSAAAKSPDLKE